MQCKRLRRQPTIYYKSIYAEGDTNNIGESNLKIKETIGALLILKAVLHGKKQAQYNSTGTKLKTVLHLINYYKVQEETTGSITVSYTKMTPLGISPLGVYR